MLTKKCDHRYHFAIKTCHDTIENPNNWPKSLYSFYFLTREFHTERPLTRE